MRKNMFIKVSGDLCHEKNFIDLLIEYTKEYFVVVCVGGGTQINEAMEKHGLEGAQFGPLGRELYTFQQKQEARDVLELNQVTLQDQLNELNIPATVIIPVLDVGSVLCHVNGDVMCKAVYNGFDKIVIVTILNRVRMKSVGFEDLPKVEVIGI